MKKIFIISLVFLFVFTFSVNSLYAVQLNLATPDPEDSPVTNASRHFAELVEEKTNGEVTIEVFPDGVLYAGTPTDAVNQLEAGSIDILINCTSLYPPFDDRFSTVSIPFLFDDVDQMMAYLNDEPGDILAEGLSEFNINVLSYWPREPRHLTSNRPIKEVSDFEGFQLRTPESPLWIEFFQAVGADPTPMDFAEVYNALQLDTIDGQENPLGVPYSASFYEVQDYLTLTGHIMVSWVAGINQDVFDSLSEEHQMAIEEAAFETQSWMREFNRDMTDYYLTALEEEGMEIIEPSQEFVDELSSIASEIYPAFESLVGEEFLNITLDWLESN